MGKAKEKAAPGRSGPKTLGRLLLMGVAALWMFALGVLVGRGTAPVHFDLDGLQKQLTELKRRVAADEGQQFKIDLEKLNFFKSLKENETKPTGTVARIEPKFKKPPERLPVQQPVPEGYLPQSGEAAAEPDAGAAGGELFIQVASSKSPDATLRLVDRLKKQGFPAFSAQIEVPSKGVWYRIQLGPFSSQVLAEQALAKMKSQHFEAYLIQR